MYIIVNKLHKGDNKDNNTLSYYNTIKIITVIIVVLNILTVTFLDSKLENKIFCTEC